MSKARGAVFGLAEGSCFHSSRAQLMAAPSPSSCSSWPELLWVREAELWLLRGKGEVQRAAQGRPCPAWGWESGWGQAQPLPALSSSAGSNTGHSQPGVAPAAALSSFPVPPSLGALRIPVGAFPALPWMEQEQNLSSSTEPALLTQRFQHLELLGMSRSWTGTRGAPLAWLCSTRSTVG